MDIVGLNTSCVGCCSLYYGADGGAYGLPGAYGLNCTNNRHWNRHYIPYPGGLVNQQGGHIIMAQTSDTTCGYCVQCQAASFVGFAGHVDIGYVPGLGGPSAVTSSSSCCCGTQGWAGAVRVTVRYL